jgi:hypothetical protein
LTFDVIVSRDGSPEEVLPPTYLNARDLELASKIIGEANGLVSRLHALSGTATRQRKELKQIRRITLELTTRANLVLSRVEYLAITAPTIDWDLWNNRIAAVLLEWLREIHERLDQLPRYV